MLGLKCSLFLTFSVPKNNKHPISIFFSRDVRQKMIVQKNYFCFEILLQVSIPGNVQLVYR